MFGERRHGGDLNACKVFEASRNMFDILAPWPGLGIERERFGSCLLFWALFGAAAFWEIFVTVARFAARLSFGTRPVEGVVEPTSNAVDLVSVMAAALSSSKASPMI